ncbi:MAG: hypothetical protein DI533_16625 [Cereibacter sphaeroides]|uniref:Uncharacterized protein n=1 Tax=Cereibacter sphaeroides TaxID=1063 RepID=A0A2W5SA94_CERSP|nr:MAG: hypothetical protein DI533_16625 [Cereibacter sphaeroides]
MIFHHEPGRQAGGHQHLRNNRLLSLGHHPPLAIPFLAPNPVFEINPRGVGLRASPCRQADSAPFEERGRTHPVMSASLRAFGVLSRGGRSPASKTGAKQMSRKDAHAFAASLAATLMVSIVVFQAGDGSFGAVPAEEIEGDEVQVITEVDPWA